MSISTATDERTEGDDDTSQGSHPKDDDSSDSENENDNQNENDTQNQNGGSPVPEVHEITSDDDDDCVVTNEDDSSNSGSDASDDSSEGSQESIKAVEDVEDKKEEDQMEMENGEDESDVEEVSMEDPLNQTQGKSKPIVINDTKSLADLASKQPKANGGDQKEPTVVIIDTNSILSGKGSIPVQNKMSTSAIDAQNLCQSIAARGTTITPVSCKASSSVSNNTQTPQPNILPSLTDDMFVVEAPSFIVPYVYEKPSVKPFREFVDKLGKELDEIKMKEEQEKLAKEKAEKERKEKEKLERIAHGEEFEEDEESEKDKIEEEAVKEKKAEKKQKRKRRPDDDDDSWDGESTSDSEAGSDEDTVVIKDKDDSVEEIKDPIAMIAKGLSGKPDSYFDCSLGQFFINIGLNLVQEYVQTDLLKQQQRKLYKEKKSGRSTKATEEAITSLTQNLDFSKKTNAPYALEYKRCEFCSFKTESLLVMAHHLEAPHMKNNIYKCNTCPFEIRSPHDILYHMEAEHNIRGRLERAPAYQQCANCHFEDNSKTKLARHLIACAKKFKPEFNLGPPLEWEPPAKIPKLTRARNNVVAPYGSNFNRQVGMNNVGRPPLNVSGTIPGMPVLGRPRGRPPISAPPRAAPVSGVPIIRSGVMIMHNTPPGTTIANYPLMPNNQGVSATPKISITPLPRAPQPSSSHTVHNSKATFVICEICDGYIKDLEQLRNHMQWIHKVKIHPKMIYNRPPLNCQKCQFRFFTDQGLERHLLGSHGLVTSSMQEAANKGKDAGRCPVCGRVYQWKLLNHVSRDHNMTLKPAHLSYKCTVCTATFGMYKQFENHVYSAHSVVAKRVMDKTKTGTTNKPADDPLLKPLKISDEITIIPQPAKSSVTITAKGK
ncbi:MOG interacting and ectopic P-granules protein 1-like [Pectinophora gossypiella]|uniref:MOG interacting and ectopic P-granules protein 1-like n=1 Tax=Pectinophora gossypiella TaxID=13191 RepID=UPI00214F18D5|nr:MOG interacting and ectopic P-granules protein 1-like [Pectinophora gossypiella]